MFSGIVERLGEIKMLDLEEKWGRIALEVKNPWERTVEQGESIAVSGICLTLTRIDEEGLFHFDVLRETFEKTNLGERKVGDIVNLERALRWGDTMGGHILIGHVDAVGEVKSVKRVGRDWAFEFTCAPEQMDGMVYKGSVGIDGVSLTVAELTDDSFVVHIIPFTYENTMFNQYKPGTPINLEVDVLGKFVRRLLERDRVLEGVTWEALRREGLVNEPSSPEE